jgi:Dipeptidyl aminopeptidases/acylaminoacyl-peptidases
MRKCLVLACLFLVVNNLLALKPKVGYDWKPNNFGLIFKEYKAPTSDGFKINVWFYPAQKALDDDSLKFYINNMNAVRPYIPDTVKRPTIVICDGDANNMQYQLGFARAYCTQGFNVITFDWRGFGGSQPFPMDTNYLVYPEFIKDYDAVIDFAKYLPSVDGNRIGVFGYSTGAYLSFYIASQRPEIKAMVGRGIFTDYQNVLPNLRKLSPERELMLPEGMDNNSPRSNWQSFKKPLFLIVGELDDRTPKENSIEILKNIKSNIRELWVVNKAEHGGMKAPEVIEWEMFLKKTTRFFNENL